MASEVRYKVKMVLGEEMFPSMEKGSLIGSASMLVIMKSISVVPFGSSFPVAIESRRTGKPREWPGRSVTRERSATGHGRTRLIRRIYGEFVLRLSSQHQD